MKEEILKTVELNEETLLYIQKAYYDFEALKSIMDTILRNSEHGFRYSNKNYEKFMAEYKDCHTLYRVIMSELLTEHSKDVKENNVECRIDFIKGEFIIFKRVGCGGC